MSKRRKGQPNGLKLKEGRRQIEDAGCGLMSNLGITALTIVNGPY